RRLARSRGRARVAAAAQQVLEEVVAGFVRHWLHASGETQVVLAGGVFANVKLNQRVHELPGVASVFVFPHMGDGRLGWGGAPHLFQGLRGGERAAEFMTMTFACTPTLADHAPAVVHVDGTARPQVVRAEVNPGTYAILEEYRHETGLPALINTSFNMHEEPI